MPRSRTLCVRVSPAEERKLEAVKQMYALTSSEYLRMLLRADLPLLESRCDAESLNESGALSGEPRIVFVDGYTMNEIAVALRRAIEAIEAVARTLSGIERTCGTAGRLDAVSAQIVADSNATLKALCGKVDALYGQFDAVLDRQILETGR